MHLHQHRNRTHVSLTGIWTQAHKPSTFYASIWFLCVQSYIWMLKRCINVRAPLSFQQVITGFDGLCFLYVFIRRLGGCPIQTKTFIFFLKVVKNTKKKQYNWQLKNVISKNKLYYIQLSGNQTFFILFIAFFLLFTQFLLCYKSDQGMILY